MKAARIISFFIVFLMTGTAFSQVRDSVPLVIADSLKEIFIYADTGKALNRVDAQGRKQGLWEKRYPNGKLRYRGHFLNDNPTGVFKYYWDNDSIQNIAIYSNYGKWAYSQMFYINGGLLSTGKFVSQKRDSIWLFYDEGFKLYKKEQYALGKKEGKSLVFYSNGNLGDSKNWHNDLENGPWLAYYEDGKLRIEASYLNGKMEGEFRLYSDGNDYPIVMGRYRNDNKDGRWIYRNTEKNKVDTLIYKNGDLLNADKYKFTQHKLDSMRIQSEPTQEKLDHPGDDGGIGR